MVSDNFHCRFGAKQRQYQYLILNNDTYSSILLSKILFIPQKLCIATMKTAINSFQQQRDFSAILPKKYEGRRMRTIDYLNINVKNIFNHEVIYIDCYAKSFGHHMIRNLVGCLIQIGLKKWSIDDLEYTLNNKIYGVQKADACGLYFMKVIY